jgi:arginase
VTGWFLLGAPWECSGSRRREQDAPAALRAAGLADVATPDLGDADTAIRTAERDPASGVRALADTGRAARALTTALADAYHDHLGRRPLVVGGDCSILFGVLPALRHRLGAAALWFG